VELVVSGPQGIQGATGPAGPGVPTGGSAGQVLVKQSATDYDLDYENAAPPVPSSKWLTYNRTLAVNSANLSAGRINAAPVDGRKSQTLDRIAVQVQTGTASVIHLGIYNYSTGVPTDLLIDAGTVDSSTTGTLEITTSVVVPRFFCIAYLVIGVVPTLRAHSEYNPLTHGNTFGQALSGTVFRSTTGQTALTSTFPQDDITNLGFQVAVRTA
jgi:hypothetical protein